MYTEQKVDFDNISQNMQYKDDAEDNSTIFSINWLH